MGILYVTTALTPDDLAKWGIVQSGDNLTLSVGGHSFDVLILGEGEEETEIIVSLTREFRECVPRASGSDNMADWDRGYIEFRYALWIAQQVAAAQDTIRLTCGLSDGNDEYAHVQFTLKPGKKDDIGFLVEAVKEFVRAFDSERFRAKSALTCKLFSLEFSDFKI